MRKRVLLVNARFMSPPLAPSRAIAPPRALRSSPTRPASSACFPCCVASRLAAARCAASSCSCDLSSASSLADTSCCTRCSSCGRTRAERCAACVVLQLHNSIFLCVPCWDLHKNWIPAAWPSPANMLRHLSKTARPSAAQCGAAHRIVPQLGLGQRCFVLCLLQPEVGLQLLHP